MREKKVRVRTRKEREKEKSEREGEEEREVEKERQKRKREREKIAKTAKNGDREIKIKCTREIFNGSVFILLKRQTTICKPC